MIPLAKGLVIGAVIILLLLISGCAGKERIVIQEVKIPVSVPCRINKPETPVYPLEEAKKDEGDIFVIVQKALAEIELRKSYIIKLDAAIEECNK